MENKFWQTTRGKAVIKFSIWMVFIIGLMMFCLFSNRSTENYLENDTNIKENNEEEVYHFENFEKMQSNLINSNYYYNYTITNESNQSLISRFSGYKEIEKDIGFLENTKGITKYIITKDGINRINLDKIETFDLLYENVDSSFLNLNLLFENLKNYTYRIEKNKDERTIIYNTKDYEINIKTNLKNIFNIIIKNNNLKYDLVFFINN